METVDFDMGDGPWSITAGPVAPPDPSLAVGEWWRKLAVAAEEATRIVGGHLSIRFVKSPGEHPERWISVAARGSENRSIRSWAERWRGHLGTGENGVGSFWDEPNGIITRLPRDGYSARGVPIACDFSLMPLVEDLFMDDGLDDVAWSLQFNVTGVQSTAEELRAARKNVSRLQSTPGVPPRIWQGQRKLVEASAHKAWRGAELLAAPDRTSLHRVASAIDRHFNASHRIEGFDVLDWSHGKDDEAVDAWMSGLHPEAFSTGDSSRVFGSLVAEECIPALWTALRDLEALPANMPALRPGVRPDVFLSYSTRDADAAFATCRLLEEQGITCWIAPRNITPGCEWPQAIVDGIRDSKVTVLLVSDGSNLSRYVLRELEITVQENHRIIPVRLEPCRLSGSIEFFLSSQQWLDAMDPPLDLHILKLADVLKQHIGK